MNLQLKKLVPAMIAAIQKHGGYVTKTKLLKLLYLLDVEYYREFRQTYTGLDWKFLHLGPWTPEVDELLLSLNACKAIFIKPSKNDAELLFSDASPDIDSFFSSIKQAAPLRTVLNLWAPAQTSEILDHVYFSTEPILLGKRGTQLDFSTIPAGPLPKYTRTSSGIPKSQIQKRREEFAKRRVTTGQAPSSYTPPKYDEEFMQAMAQLNDPAADVHR